MFEKGVKFRRWISRRLLRVKVLAPLAAAIAGVIWDRSREAAFSLLKHLWSFLVTPTLMRPIYLLPLALYCLISAILQLRHWWKERPQNKTEETFHFQAVDEGGRHIIPVALGAVWRRLRSGMITDIEPRCAVCFFPIKLAYAWPDRPDRQYTRFECTQCPARGVFGGTPQQWIDRLEQVIYVYTRTGVKPEPGPLAMPLVDYRKC